LRPVAREPGKLGESARADLVPPDLVQPPTRVHSQAQTVLDSPEHRQKPRTSQANNIVVASVEGVERLKCLVSRSRADTKRNVERPRPPLVEPREPSMSKCLFGCPGHVFKACSDVRDPPSEDIPHIGKFRVVALVVEA